MLTSFDTLPSSQRDTHQNVNRSCADNSKSNYINGTEIHPSKREQVVRLQQQVELYQRYNSDSNTTASRIQVDQVRGVPSARTSDMLTTIETLPSSQKDSHATENRSCTDNSKSNNISGTKAILTQLPLGFGWLTIQESHRHAPGTS